MGKPNLETVANVCSCIVDGPDRPPMRLILPVPNRLFTVGDGQYQIESTIIGLNRTGVTGLMEAKKSHLGDHHPPYWSGR